MFKIKHTNHNGSFSVKLNRPIDGEDMQQLALIAYNLLSDEAKADTNSGDLSKQESETLLSHIQHDSNIQQRLGERPVDSIKMGDYKEPERGVRIRMLSMPDPHRMDAIRAFRAATGLSILSTRDIVYGNYPCVVMSLDTAHTIMKSFTALNVHAKIVPASESTWPMSKGA